MITINYITENNIPIDQVLTDYDKRQLLIENCNTNFSYYTLLKEVLVYNHVTPKTLLNGWSGVKLVK